MTEWDEASETVKQLVGFAMLAKVAESLPEEPPEREFGVSWSIEVDGTDWLDAVRQAQTMCHDGIALCAGATVWKVVDGDKVLYVDMETESVLREEVRHE